MRYTNIQKILVAAYAEQYGSDQAVKEFSAKKTTINSMKYQVREIIPNTNNLLKLAKEISKIKFNKSIENLNPNNNKNKGIEYFAIWDLVNKQNIFENGGYILSMPGIEYTDFERRLLQQFPNINKIIAVEKDTETAGLLFNKFLPKMEIHNSEVFEYLKNTQQMFKLIWLDLYGMPTIKNSVSIIEKHLEPNSIFALTVSKRGYDKNREDELGMYNFIPSENFQKQKILWKDSWNYFPGMEFQLFTYKGGET